MRALVGGSWEVLASRSCKILSGSSTSFYDYLVRLSEGSWHEDLGQCPLKVLVRRSWGDPSEMLSQAFAWSYTSHCEKLLKRSRCSPLGVLTWSGTSPCEKMLWRSCWNPPQDIFALNSACVKVFQGCSYEVLVYRSCESLYTNLYIATDIYLEHHFSKISEPLLRTSKLPYLEHQKYF